MKQQFDLYKWIIIGSLVVLPVAGGWVYWLERQIAQGEQAIAVATRSGTGELQTIGRLLAEIESTAKSAGTASAEDPLIYFDRQVNRSAEQGLKRNDYQIIPVSALPNQETKSIDRLFKIEFKRDGKQFALPRPLVEAVMFNIEAQSPAWRLRSLNLRNQTTGEKQMRNSGFKPPPEVEDSWFVDKMEFARREPDPNAGKRGK